MRALWTQDRVKFAGKHLHGEGLDRAATGAAAFPSGWVAGASYRSGAPRSWPTAWVPGPTANLEKLLAAQTQYHAELQAAGKDPALAATPLTREVIVAETRERAWELAEQHLMVNYRDEYGGGPGSTRSSAARTVPPWTNWTRSAATASSSARPKTASPSHPAAFSETFGLDHLICRLYFPGMPHEHIMQELKLLAAEVIPAFR